MYRSRWLMLLTDPDQVDLVITAAQNISNAAVMLIHQQFEEDTITRVQVSQSHALPIVAFVSINLIY